MAPDKKTLDSVKAEWFRRGQKASQTENPETPKPETTEGPDELTLADVQGMSPDEINDRWDEVTAAMERAR